MQAHMIAPAAILVLWSILMLFWMAGTRFPALKKLRQTQSSNPSENIARPGVRGQDLDAVLPPHVMWKAHNYNHLMEQPTIFYAVSGIFAILGADALDIALAWVYVALRIAHSLWQSLVNTIPVRILLFTISSIVLLVLALRAVALTLF